MTITVASIYIARMIPLAQTEQLLQLIKASFGTDQFKRYAPAVQKYSAELLDTLHLLNLFLQANPHIKLNVAQKVDASLQLLQAELRSVLDYMSGEVKHELSELVCKAIKKQKVRAHYGEVSRINGYVKALQERADNPIKMLQRVIGYDAQSRMIWFSAQSRASSASPLVKDGKPSYWLTLPNNFDWQPTLASLFGGRKVPFNGPNTGSDEGRKRLNVLLQGLPGYSLTLIPNIAYNAMAGASSYRVPEGVAIAVEDGLLVVSKEATTPDSDGRLLKKEYKAWVNYCSLNGVDVLTNRSVSVKCGADMLVQSIELLQTKLDKIKERDDKLIADFRAFTTREEQKAVLEKLKTVLDPRELKLLEGLMPK